MTDEGPCVETNGAHVIGLWLLYQHIRKLILSLSFSDDSLRNGPMWACFYLLGGSTTAVLKSGESQRNTH